MWKTSSEKGADRLLTGREKHVILKAYRRGWVWQPGAAGGNARRYAPLAAKECGCVQIQVEPRIVSIRPELFRLGAFFYAPMGREEKMRRLFWRRAGFLALSLCLILAAALVPTRAERQVLLCGEAHDEAQCKEQELALWRACYAAGDRDLFLELGAATTELLNRWMRTGDESFWDLVYRNWEGTLSQTELTEDFYRQLRADCPETVFHGIDLEHQYRTTGRFCLALLEKEGRQGTDTYRKVLRSVEQGERFYQGWDGDLFSRDNAYREEVLAENFHGEYEALGRRRVMGIFGAAHTDPYGLDYYTASVPSMGAQLRERYGGDILCRDLRGENLPEKTTLSVAGTEFEAIYYGETPLRNMGLIRSCQVWRLVDAYETFSQWEASGDNRPGNTYPMTVRAGEAYAIHYHCWDGTDFWWYGVCEGMRLENGALNTAEVIPPEAEREGMDNG